MKVKQHGKRGHIKRLLCLLLTVTLLMQCVPLQSMATGDTAESVHTESTVSDTAEEALGSEMTLIPQIVGEEETLRSESAKHFRLSDGSFVAVSYGTAVHYQDDAGNWRDIDNTPIRTMDASGKDTYRIINDDLAVAFAASLEDGALFTAAYQDVSVSISLLDTVQAQSLKHGTVMTANANVGIQTDPEEYLIYSRDAKAELPVHQDNPISDGKKGWSTADLAPKELSTEIIYEQVFPGIDLHYSVIGFDIKEEIVVGEKQERYRFDFLLKSDGLTAQLNTDGSVSLLDKEEKEIYLIPAPFMKDSSGAVSQDVHYILTNAGDGVILTVEADESWINAEGRQFPVTIDPTLVTQVINGNYYSGEYIYSTFVQEGDPDESVTDVWFLYTGYETSHDKEYQAFFYFNNMPDIPSGSVVTDATIELYLSEYSSINCDQIPMGMYEVSQDTAVPEQNYQEWILDMTWNTKPSYEDNNLIDYAMVSPANRGQYVGWNIDRKSVV